MMRSNASAISSLLISLRLRRAARIAASFIKFCRSAPVKPGVLQWHAVICYIYVHSKSTGAFAYKKGFASTTHASNRLTFYQASKLIPTATRTLPSGVINSAITLIAQRTTTTYHQSRAEHGRQRMWGRQQDQQPSPLLTGVKSSPDLHPCPGPCPCCGP